MDLTGPLPYNELQQRLPEFDLLILPSLAEGSARICLEAMHAGLPVITTFESGSAVRDTKDGFITPPRSATAITERLEQVAANRDLLATMSANARQHARTFSLEWYSTQLTELVHTPEQESHTSS